ncbi:hypothetical protein Moror_3738 [Moniliophthora roreri MCA 2997]|uniref:Uncharacterized protein n=2 Tax=Moniliophthora roreri TaxID=221103 RepID=V2WMC5_MONRO|nr:hypothetical protein Moror_3738 [Moniliophthora roreri MCA 2997]
MPPLNPELLRNDSPPPLMRPLNPLPTTPSFILTPLPIPTSNLRSSWPITPPPENPHPQAPSTLAVFRHLRPQFHPEVEIVPAVSGEVPSEMQEDKNEDEDEEN